MEKITIHNASEEFPFSNCLSDPSLALAVFDLLASGELRAVRLVSRVGG